MVGLTAARPREPWRLSYPETVSAPSATTGPDEITDGPEADRRGGRGSHRGVVASARRRWADQPSTRGPVGRWTRRILVANLVGQIGIILTGGLVRLTGSGLGCSTWPRCEPGTFTPVFEPATPLHAYVEFGNRLLTFVVGALAIATVVAVWRLRGRRPSLRLLGAAPLLGVLLQAAIGGITVLTRLNPWTVMLHFMVSIGLVAVSTLLLLRAREGDGPVVAKAHPVLRQLAAVMAVVASGVLVLGTAVTGAGPHAGDAGDPVRLDIDPRTISWLHADLVLLFLGLAVGLYVALRVTDAPHRAVWWASAVLVVTLAQGALGYVQYALAVPISLVWLHMLGACLLTVAVTGLQLGLRERALAPVGLPAPRDEPVPAR